MTVGSVLAVELIFSWVILVFMNLKILSWNVRGLNDRRKRSIVKNLLRDWKFDVICLQETKLTGMDRQTDGGEFVELPLCGLGGFGRSPDSRWDFADVG